MLTRTGRNCPVRKMSWHFLFICKEAKAFCIIPILFSDLRIMEVHLGLQICFVFLPEPWRVEFGLYIALVLCFNYFINK